MSFLISSSSYAPRHIGHFPFWSSVSCICLTHCRHATNAQLALVHGRNARSVSSNTATQQIGHKSSSSTASGSGPRGFRCGDRGGGCRGGAAAEWAPPYAPLEPPCAPPPREWGPPEEYPPAVPVEDDDDDARAPGGGASRKNGVGIAARVRGIPNDASPAVPADPNGDEEGGPGPDPTFGRRLFWCSARCSRRGGRSSGRRDASLQTRRSPERCSAAEASPPPETHPGGAAGGTTGAGASAAAGGAGAAEDEEVKKDGSPTDLRPNSTERLRASSDASATVVDPGGERVVGGTFEDASREEASH